MRALYSSIAYLLYSTYLTVYSCHRLVWEAEAILACTVVVVELAHDISSFAHITYTLATEKEREKEVVKQEEEEALKIFSGVEAAVALPANNQAGMNNASQQQQMFLQQMNSLNQQSNQPQMPLGMPNPMKFPMNPGWGIPNLMNFPMNQANTMNLLQGGQAGNMNQMNQTPKPIESSKPTHDDELRRATARSGSTQFSFILDVECCTAALILVTLALLPVLYLRSKRNESIPRNEVPGGLPLVGHVDDGNNTSVCIICLEHRRSHAFVPCGHMCLCDHCSSRSPYSQVRYSIRRAIFVSVIDAIRYSVRLIFRSTVLSRRGISCPICRDSSSAIMKIYNS
ncbi:predicted protein [Chaetoceros tenuissimus]|uniref:RING-type domain-containing protein n=1 Tax=Chaetoceros tenuissimus TaxID=426638 RepID=A0AAD3CUD3_9STRA|nr:predicted protein [Chaetoceros tenuissimus]